MATAPDDYPHGNPIFAGRALNLPLTSYEPPAVPKRPNVPPVIGEIVGKLGLRYLPSGQADREAHAEALKLLAEDVADVPAPLLDEAAKRWARESKFMPKAAELRDLARKVQAESVAGRDAGRAQLQAHCDRLNVLNDGRDGWHVVGKVPNRMIAKRNEREAA